MNNIIETKINKPQIIEINKKELNNNNTQINNNEDIPILSSSKMTITSVEDYYRTYYPEYTIIKFMNCTFIKMGKLITFYFDKNNNYVPKLSIGPNWNFSILLVVVILFFEVFLYFTIFKLFNTLKKIIYFLFAIIVYYFVFCAVLIHPKVVMNKNKSFNEYEYCYSCKVFFNPSKTVKHCNSCGVCFESMDHHCLWVGKCVAKNNTFYFYAMIVSICIFYGYIIFCSISMAMKK